MNPIRQNAYLINYERYYDYNNTDQVDLKLFVSEDGHSTRMVERWVNIVEGKLMLDVVYEEASIGWFNEVVDSVKYLARSERG